LELVKADGRHLTLYGRAPVRAADAPSPLGEPLDPNPHLRWHPLRGEWITYAAYRQGRTFLPPPEYNPLAVTVDPANPTELPAGDYDIAVFDNRFPSLALAAHDPPEMIVPTAPATGRCEVVVFTQDPTAALATLPLTHIELLFQVWADRTERAVRNPSIRYVLPFENRGAEVGVTLHHPHGQIYAYPVVPPVPARMQAQEVDFYREHGRTLLANLITSELKSGERLLYQGEYAVAFVPVCARYPYEVWVVPLQAVAGFAELSAAQRLDLARALKTVLLKYEGLWQRPFPYLMAWYQAPVDGVSHPEAHLHAEFYPPYRSRDRLKYLAGTELAAGMFAMDALPEDKARELQQVEIMLE
jgi:UDPglucose--hexose-1-phosphate uridylyltransferase